jgi:DNA-binding Lrp family transcriptional regulator
MHVLFNALANSERVQVIERLLRYGPQSQAQLCEALGEVEGTMSKRVRVLLHAGIVSRDSPRGNCYVTDPDATIRVLKAAADLDLAIAEIKAASARERVARLRRLQLRPVDDEESA